MEKLAGTTEALYKFHMGTHTVLSLFYSHILCNNHICFQWDIFHMSCFEQWAQLSVEGRWMSSPSWSVISLSVVVMGRVSFLFLTVYSRPVWVLLIPVDPPHSPVAPIARFTCDTASVAQLSQCWCTQHRQGCVSIIALSLDQFGLIQQRSFCSSVWRIAGGHVKCFWSFPHDMQGASQAQDP